MIDREKEIKEIIRACAEDVNLRRIIFEIDRMCGEDRAIFGKKMDRYFFSKSSEEDLQAYKFFKTILDDQFRKDVIVYLKGK
jgi:hypothetical protein